MCAGVGRMRGCGTWTGLHCSFAFSFKKSCAFSLIPIYVTFSKKKIRNRHLVNILIPTLNMNSEIGLGLQTQEMTLAHLSSNRTTQPSV